MPATREDLFARLAELAIATETIEHPATFTVAESERLGRALAGADTKNLFLRDEAGALFLVVARAQARVDLKALSKRLRAKRFSFGRPELLLATLGVPPGSVTPFALMNDKSLSVRPVIDRELMLADRINCHPLQNTATTSIAREDLIRFIRACGHQPIIETVVAESDSGTG